MPVPSTAAPLRRSSVQNSPQISRPSRSLQIQLRKLSRKCSRRKTPLQVRQLPIEIWDLIVEYMLMPHNLFSSIAAFTLISSSFRQIALRQYFKHLHVCSSSMWKLVSAMPHIGKWARSLQASISHLLFSPTFISSFTILQSLHISFVGQTLASQPHALVRLLLNVPTQITSLTLVNLAEIDTLTLSLLGTRFTGLRTLELSCSERLDTACCWECFEESASCVCFSPLPDRYGTLGNLIKALKNTLGAITHLRHLHLGFFLSHGDMLYDHFRHAQDDAEPDDIPNPHPAHIVAANNNEEGNTYYNHNLNPTPTSPAPESHAPNSPPGASVSISPFGPEWCDLCFTQHAESVRSDELDASLALARHFRELESVGWSTFFGKKWEEIERRRTTVWVKRVEGKVKVRRKPW